MLRRFRGEVVAVLIMNASDNLKSLSKVVASDRNVDERSDSDTVKSRPTSEVLYTSKPSAHSDLQRCMLLLQSLSLKNFSHQRTGERPYSTPKPTRQQSIVCYTKIKDHPSFKQERYTTRSAPPGHVSTSSDSRQEPSSFLLFVAVP